MTIAIDFDGTITYSPKQYPIPGEIRPYAQKVINALIERGHDVILWTCRDHQELELAKKFLKQNDIKISKFNVQNVQSCSNKIVADIYIDDKAFPQCFNEVDWKQIGQVFNIFV